MDDSQGGERTSATLLVRVAQSPRDERAWGAFVATYGALIHRWCRRWGLQEADAEDVAQTVLVDLTRALPGFEYDRSRSFRAWLKTAARHATARAAARLARAGRGGGDDPGWLDGVEAREELADRLTREFDLDLLAAATERVKSRVKPVTWEAFRLLAHERKSGEEVAALLGISAESAYKARSNLVKLLREEVRALEEAADRTLTAGGQDPGPPTSP